MVTYPDEKWLIPHDPQLKFSAKTQPAEIKFSKEIISQVRQHKESASKKLPTQDLLVGSAILVSSTYNANDIVFLPEEVWKAKETILNKPYNHEHAETHIIGNITSCRVLDSDGNEVTEENFNNQYIDIEVGFVLYSRIFPHFAEEVEDGFEDGVRFVSMECYYPDFDYGLVSDAKYVKIIERNEKTAFLTKYLRRFGGTGLYENSRIMMVPRQIHFAGMANVKNPANKKSEYTKIISYNMYNISENEKINEFNSSKGSNEMTIEQAQEKINTLTNQNSELASKVNDLTVENTKIAKLEAEIASKNEEIAKTQNDVKAISDKLSLAEKATNELEGKGDELQSQIDELTKARNELQAKIDEVEKEKVIAKRTVELAETGFEFSDEEKERILAASDEVFTDYISFAKKMKEKVEKEDKKNKEDKSMFYKKNKADDDEEVEVNATETENADSAAASQGIEDTVKETASKVAQFLYRDRYQSKK